MAAVDQEGTNYAAAYSTINGRADGKTRLRVVWDVWTMASQAAGSTFKAGLKIPAGAVPLFGIVRASATLGGTATIAIGDGDDADEYMAALASTAVTPQIFGIAGTTFTELSVERTLTVTTAAAALPSSGTLAVALVYADF